MRLLTFQLKNPDTLNFRTEGREPIPDPPWPKSDLDVGTSMQKEPAKNID